MENSLRQEITELNQQINVLTLEKADALKENDRLIQKLDQKSVVLGKVTRKNREYLSKVGDLERELDQLRFNNRKLNETVDLMYRQEMTLKNTLHELKALKHYTEALELKLSLVRLLK